ncbi:YeeE/YedE family integral membrane protein-like protein [Ophiobolus disseminans]|uniref:YeeE/YedE family integral membrane protein-like protein n=1 Tax=Ophiobolus disseminans TaxID=1469910 RepID=A0A6A7A9Y3_9PLEO|nr:YeeE/YedE family integral membrane protein-like protein [Ophiobolus disseminans]
MFTPVETGIGAILLHQATSNLLYKNGNVLGVSGFLRQLFTSPTKETIAFFVGMAASYVPLKALTPHLITSYPAVPTTPQAALLTIGVGAIVGLGTKMSNGCTSGHMLCGLSRSSGRSAVAVATFFPVAILTHHLVHPTLCTEVCPSTIPCYTPIYPTATTTVSLILLATVSILAARTVPKLVESFFTAQVGEAKRPTDAHSPARQATQFFSGLLFALGLHVSQMSHPAKITSFLSFPAMQHWDPSLALVILFGVLPNFIEIQQKGFSSPPRFAGKFSLPTKTIKDIDTKFVAGAAVFGVGWGLTGTCPGPAVLRALAQPLWGALWMGGFWLGGRVVS